MQNKTKSILIILALFISAPALCAQIAEIKILVNGKPISNFDIQQQARMLLVTSNIEVTAQNTRQANERAKEQLTDNILRAGEAKKNNISVSQSEIETAIKRGIPQGQSVKTFISFLKKNNVQPKNFYNHVRAELLWSKYLERHIVPSILVPQNQVDQKLTEITESLKQKSYLLSQIVVRFENLPEEKNAKNLSAQLRDQLNNGASFDSLARNFSQSRESTNGGDLGWVTKNTLPKKLKNIVTSMKVGKISPVIHLTDGFYIIQLRDIRTQNDSNLQKIVLDIKLLRVPVNQNIKKVERNFSTCNKLDDYANSLGGEIDVMGFVPLTDLSKKLQRKLNNPKPNMIVHTSQTKTAQEFIIVCDKNIQENPGLSRKKIENQILSEQVFIRARQKLRDLRRNASIEAK